MFLYAQLSKLIMTCQGMDTYSGENKGLGQGGTYNAVGMTPSTSNTLIGTSADQFDLKLKQIGSFSYTVAGKIYNASGTLVDTSNNVISDSDLSTSSFTQVTFSFNSSFTVTEGFKYVITVASGTFDNSNRVDVQMNSSTADNNVTAILDSSTWTTNSLPCAVCFSSSTPSGGSTLLPPPVAWI
jgi:hypothetical protein